MAESLTKIKLIDPLILSLLENIRGYRSMLKDLNSIKVDPKLSLIISNEEGKELYIENEFHKARGFRKLHIELAEFSKNLKILHCVFFPDPKFDIPIFGMDLVMINKLVSAAIVDLSPSSDSQNLEYEESLYDIDRSIFSNIREIPKWGDIFSKNVFFASLKNDQEKEVFCKIVDNYLSNLVSISQRTNPDNDNLIIKNRMDCQKYYCTQQMKNDKTSLVLLKYFDKEWVDDYIKKILFDF